VQVYAPGPNDPILPPDNVAPPDDPEDPVPLEPAADEQVVVDAAPPDIHIGENGHQRSRKYYVRDQPVAILKERIEYLDENGKLVTESLRDYSRKTLRRRFASLDDFLIRWNATDRKQVIIDELAEEGLLLGPLADEVGVDLDPFDLVCHVAFDQPPLTRRDRADNVRKRDVFTKYGPQARTVLEALLDKYQHDGVTGLSDPQILKVTPFLMMGTPIQLLNIFGGRDGFEKAVHELESALYEPAA
jgi:type I restriction enzyme R subunit